MNTNESVAHSAFATIIRNNVITPIVNYLATKNIQVTVDELAGVLKLVATTPVSNSVSNSVSNMVTPQLTQSIPSAQAFPTNGFPMATGFPPVSNVPPTITGLGGVPIPVPSAKKGRSKTTAPTMPVADHERCMYKITRGRNKDQRCENKAEPGLPFCSTHKNTKAAQQQLQSGGVPMNNNFTGIPNMPGVNGSFSGMPSVPGLQATFTGIPNMLGSTMAPVANGTLSQLNPSLTNTLTAQVPHEGPKLQVQQLKDGMYLEKNHNLLIKTGNHPNEYICLGLYDLKTAQTNPLTPDKIEICKQLKISYVDPNKTDDSSTTSVQQTTPVTSVTGQSLPNVNQQLPGVSTNMFSASGLPGLSMSGLTGLPSVSSQQMTQQFGLPQVSSMSNLGMGVLQGIPAVTDFGAVDDPNDEDDEEDEEVVDE